MSDDVHVCTEAHVNDCICLDVVHVRVAETQLLAPPLGGADNTRCDGVLQGERASNGNHELARAQVCRASQQQHRQLYLHCHTTRGSRTRWSKWSVDCPPVQEVALAAFANFSERKSKNKSYLFWLWFTLKRSRRSLSLGLHYFSGVLSVLWMADFS